MTTTEVAKKTVFVLNLHTVQFGGDPDQGLSNEEIHLEADQDKARGVTLCGIELFPRDEAGKLIPRGWGRRGGDTGPNCRRVPCPPCRDAVNAMAPAIIEDRTFNLDWRKPKVSE